MDMALK